MKLFRNILDERQNLEAMQIQRIGFWIVELGLLAAVIVQLIFDAKDTHVAGEFIVMLAGAIWMGIGYFHRGIWDAFTRPGTKSYIFYSVVTGIICGIILSPPTMYLRLGSLLSYLFIFALNFIIIFAVTFILELLYGKVIKAQKKSSK